MATMGPQRCVAVLIALKARVGGTYQKRTEQQMNGENGVQPLYGPPYALIRRFAGSVMGCCLPAWHFATRECEFVMNYFLWPRMTQNWRVVRSAPIRCMGALGS